ncbi:hypothetical protein D3C84_966370 [compost metagenome]
MKSNLTADDIQAMGYIAGRKLPDGRWLAVAKMFTNGRVYFNLDHFGAEAAYCYTSVDEACAAMNAFDPDRDEEPQGWHKCATDNRVRPGGDASKETIGYPPHDSGGQLPNGKV